MTTATTGTPLQQSPYLREQRKFPRDSVEELSRQVDNAYIDVASKVNLRTIGIYARSFPVITGNNWYLLGSAQKQQSLRQVYTFTGAGSVPHGINFASVSQVSPNSYGSYTDGTNWYGAIYASSVPIAGQVSFYVTPTNIIVLSGAGAPAITTGTIIIEWISQF